MATVDDLIENAQTRTTPIAGGDHVAAGKPDRDQVGHLARDHRGRVVAHGDPRLGGLRAGIQTLLAPAARARLTTADWLERGGYEMFGITFRGHPDLRRILMWEQYREGFPLRKDFPLRGRFSRAEQLRQALAANPEARYSMEELTIAQAFEDLPEDVLSDLAGRVQLRVVRAGQAIFRQGDRGDAFYVVRQGEVVIETEHPQTGETSTLRTLRRGDSFGELGLLQSTPRSATARASGEVELFEVDRGTFDRLLADSIDAPEFGLTLQAMAELREHPAFRHLSSEALGNLITYGRWVNPSAGEVIVTQGEPGDAFYAIRSGRVDVIRDGQQVTREALDHPFRKMDNVVLTPHLGYVSERNYRVLYTGVVEDIRAWLDGKPVRVIESK